MNIREILGKRIREERTKLKISQEELAKRVGWGSHVQVSNVESGTRGLKVWELSKIATALRMEISALMDSEAVGREPTPFVLWRQRPANADEVQADFFKKSSNYARVERLLKLDSSIRKLPFEKLDLGNDDESRIYLMADKIRDEMALGKFPAKSLVQTLEDIYGVKFIIKDLPDGGAAATCFSKKLGPCILLNSNDVLWRQNYSIAHELFHLVTWDEEPFKLLEKNGDLKDKNERYAECFAAGLLIPRDSLVSEIAKIQDASGHLSYAAIVSLSRQFEVSAQAMIYRMRNLKIIPWKTALQILGDSQFQLLNKMSNKTREHTSRLSERLIRVSYQAYTMGKISRAKLAEILEVSLIDLEQTLNDNGLIEDVENSEIEISNS